MAGQSTNLLWTYLTPRRVYRYRVAAADTAPGGSLPIIYADISSNRPPTLPPVPTGRVSGFGSNTTLALEVLYTPPTGTAKGLMSGIGSGDTPPRADIRVWMLADVEGLGYGSVPGPSDIPARWVLVREQSVVCNTFMQLVDVPAAKYCVTVDYITAGAVAGTDTGTVTIVEQHTE
jgi:hypothetical protein